MVRCRKSPSVWALPCTREMAKRSTRCWASPMARCMRRRLAGSRSLRVVARHWHLAGAREIDRGIDQGHVREGLGEVPQEPPPSRIVLFGEQPDVVGQAAEALEEGTRFLDAAL